jgi:hypothetical protein
MIQKVFKMRKKDIVFKDFETIKVDIMGLENYRLKKNINKIQKEMLLQTLEINYYLSLPTNLNLLT